MMSEESLGIVISGDGERAKRSSEDWLGQKVDLDLSAEPSDPPDAFQTTIAKPASVTGPGTFFGKEFRTLVFEPSDSEGWWFDRRDLPASLPIRASIREVWNTQRNIVLRSGSPHNYMRMVEHIVALRLGMGIDNLVVKAASGDPPLFDRSSMDIVEALESAGIKENRDMHVSYTTVKERVTVVGGNGSFLTVAPCAPDDPVLRIDCAINFPNAIGRQRIIFNLNRKRFRQGAAARTNTTEKMVLYCHTIGKLFADTRNLGYTRRNILIAGKKNYSNQPLLMHEGKSLEAVWHRSMLDLLAAVALIDHGRFVGNIVSYKAGHALDVEMVKLLYKYNVFKPVKNPVAG
jgi:UDP-3-O-acyl-N-acetylglucosamine deacetylase